MGDLIPDALSSEAKIVVDRQAEPGFRRHPEVSSQPQCSIGSDGTGAIHDGADAVGRYIQIAGQFVGADP